MDRPWPLREVLSVNALPTAARGWEQKVAEQEMDLCSEIDIVGGIVPRGRSENTPSFWAFHISQK